MDNQVDVKFRLKQRKVRGSQSKREGLSTENVLITMRVTYLSMRLEFSTGYHIDVLRWDQNAERAIGPNRDGQSADEINGGIMRLARNVRDTAHMFEEMEKVPTQEQFRETFEQIRAEEQQHIALNVASATAVKNTSENQDRKQSKQDSIRPKQRINKNYETKIKTENNKSFGFFEVFHEYERSNSRLHDWTESTFKKYHTLRNNLTDMRKYKRKAGLKFFDFTFEYFDEYGLQEYIDFLRSQKDYKNTSVTKSLRYSDVANLKRCDVHDDYIEITTIKTCDSLRIDLNKHSKAILDKYKMFEFPNGKALPVISNQRSNEYIHLLCKEAKIDEQVRQTYYKGNDRIDVVRPKYELVGSHTGRRTFICNALAMGIPPQVIMKWTGHSDYKAMKPYIDVCDEIKAEQMKKFNDF